MCIVFVRGMISALVELPRIAGLKIRRHAAVCVRYFRRDVEPILVVSGLFSFAVLPDSRAGLRAERTIVLLDLELFLEPVPATHF